MKIERTAIGAAGWVMLVLWSPLFVAGSLAAAPSGAPAQPAPAKKDAKSASAKAPAKPAAAPVKVALTALQTPAPITAGQAEAQIAEPIHDLNLQPNQQQILDFGPISQVALVNPSVADFVLVGGSTMVVTAKAVGETLLFVTHGRRRTIFRINVIPAPSPDLQQLAAQVQASINRPEVTVRTVGKQLFLEGEVADQAELDRVLAIVKAFGVDAQNVLRIRPTVSPPQVAPAQLAVDALKQAIGLPSVNIRAIGPNTVAIEGRLASQAEADRVRALVKAIAGNVQIVDLLSAPAPEPRTVRQVLIRARVVEINKTAMKSLGSQFGSASISGGVATITPTFGIVQTQSGPFGDIFTGGGPFQRLNPFGFQISAILNEGAGRVLSEPNILVMEGMRGNILVGGEFPYLAAVTTGGTTAGGQPLATVEFKTFGIQLTVEPRLINENDVTLRVVPEVSLPDFSRSVSVGGSVVPPLSTRHAETIVRLQNGQTMAIGGLLQDDYTVNVNRFPWVSKIPVLGEFFRKRDVDRTQSELVILITPEILGPGQVPSTAAPPTEIRRPPVPEPRRYHE